MTCTRKFAKWLRKLEKKKMLFLYLHLHLAVDSAAHIVKWGPVLSLWKIILLIKLSININKDQNTVNDESTTVDGVRKVKKWTKGVKFWLINRGGEEGSDGGDGAAARRTEADIQRKRERKWGVLGHVWGQRQIKSHTYGGPS